MKLQTKKHLGFTLVEMMIVAALSAVVFGALFSSFQYSLKLISNSRAKLSALSLANDRMEYYRSLPYAEVGVVAGYPAGTIPQNSVISLNGIDFAERVRVDYIDDPQDGIAGSDTNGIILDYKQIRLEYTWNISGATSSVQLISYIVPRSVETTAGGGTARINVLDANSALLPGASVRLVGSSSTFPYDVTNYTDASGAALFNVPADGGYQAIVTANISGKQYSTAQTYVATTSNPNPAVAPFAVLESDVSTLTFQIGELSDMEISTFSSLVSSSTVEEFSDLSGVASVTNITSDTDLLVLTNTLGVYDSSGTAYLNTITPTPLLSWEKIRVAADLPVNTTHKVQLFTGVAPGPYTLIPEVDLPGNATGFITTMIDLSSLDTVTYPSIVVGVTLGTSDTSVTPAIDEIGVYYRESASPLASVDLDIRGDKIIGTDLSLQPIYKYTNSVVTNGSGQVSLSDIEFDAYTFSDFSGYDVAIACPAHPFIQEAGIDGNLELMLVANAVNTLRLTVVNSLGQTIPGAKIRMTRPGYDTTLYTGTCGQAFFTGGMSVNNDYTIEISATGYFDETITSFEIDGDKVTTVTLTE